MKRLLFVFMLSFTGYCISFGQVQFVQRMEVNTKWEDDDFIILNKEDGLVGFRMVSATGMSRDRNLEYFVADRQLQLKDLKQLSVKTLYNLLGFDLDGDWLTFYSIEGKTMPVTSTWSASTCSRRRRWKYR